MHLRSRGELCPRGARAEIHRAHEPCLCYTSEKYKKKNIFCLVLNTFLQPLLVASLCGEGREKRGAATITGRKEKREKRKREAASPPPFLPLLSSNQDNYPLPITHPTTTKSLLGKGIGWAVSHGGGHWGWGLFLSRREEEGKFWAAAAQWEEERRGRVTEWICRLEGGKGKLASFLFLFSVKKDGSDSQKIVALVVPSSSPCGPPSPPARQGEASIFWAAQFLFFSFCALFLNEGGGGREEEVALFLLLCFLLLCA